MKASYILWCVIGLALIIVAPAGAADEGQASLRGKLMLPAGVGTQKRAFRSALYRNRQTSTQRQANQREKKSDAPAEHAIISAHPLSFTLEVQPLAQAVEIEQVDVSFGPRVTVVTVGSTVEFINQDEIYHNVFSLTKGARFNVGRHPTGDIVAQQVQIEGEIDLFCDIHPQMHGTILSLNTPYFTRAAADGSYYLKGLPPGTYEVHVFHPDLAPMRVEVELRAGEEAVRDFNLSR